MGMSLDDFLEYVFLREEIKKEKDIDKLFIYAEDSLRYILGGLENEGMEKGIIHALKTLGELKNMYEKGFNFVGELGLSYREYKEIYLDLLKDINYKLIEIRAKSKYMNNKKLRKSLDEVIGKMEKISYIKSFIEGIMEQLTLPEELKREYFNRALSYLKT